ncbi:MAG: hypothetical protein M1820_001954 [Bogoriella megaspora]|nr:MAG: hypothetical protein M1820_001954 [Bogoriella megaspora]
MKCSWHVYNLKRRIASLPPISSDIFKDQIQPESKSVPREPREETIEDIDQDIISPRQCLFCQETFNDDTEYLEDTVDHMFTAHGLFIPDQDMISDLECFLSYLATEVREWHECLYCGTTRNSTLAIQSHMRDSGHCMLNLDREPELSEFWECRSDEEGKSANDVARPGVRFTEGPLLLSGKVASSRGAPRRRIKAPRARHTHLALLADPEPSIPPGPSRQQNRHQPALRDEMGLRNIDNQQRHGLILAEKRSQKDEAVATRAREWSYAKKANTQKHDQSHGPLSWAKGGLHNLLPR